VSIFADSGKAYGKRGEELQGVFRVLENKKRRPNISNRILPRGAEKSGRSVMFVVWAEHKQLPLMPFLFLASS
jgi:hypothetical protein